MAFFAARVSAIYSASIDNKATIACLLEYKLTGLLFSMKMNSNVNFFIVWLLAQSELE